jgi:hypothetical protein
MMDAASILGSLFGGQGSTGAILATLARDFSRGTTSIAHLAREARLSETKALREVNRLDELDLVVTELRGRHRHVSLNDASPFHAPLLEMLYLAYGVRPQPDDEFEGDWHTPRLGARVPFELVRLIPDELHPTSPAGSDRTFTDDHYDGPEPLQARLWERKLGTLAAEAGQTEALLQGAYGTWREERDHDLIHQMLHLGTGAAFAARVLARAADHGRHRGRDDTRVGRKEWRLAIAATRAEAALCQNKITDLDRAVGLARDRRRELALIGELEDHLADDPAVSPRDAGARDLTDAAGRVAGDRRSELAGHRATLETLEEQMRDTYRTGGLGVRVDEVNTAGERLIIERLRWVAAVATDHADAMERAAAADAEPAPPAAPEEPS